MDRAPQGKEARLMDAFLIEGGRRLEGTIRVNGSKNATLPLMAAALMTDEPVMLDDAPHLADVRNMGLLLTELGCRVNHAGGVPGESHPGGMLTIQTQDETASEASYDVVRTMRASVCVLGPLLARRGSARVSMPGGCAIGHRPVDIHLRGLRALGAQITLDAGYIEARAPRGGRLEGARVFLGGPAGPTVLGTANVMSAAALAIGTTIIESAACEPEIIDVADLLCAMGARITGAGTPRIVIEGVDSLHGAQHQVIPDRIEAGTYILASAITGGDVTIENCPIDDLTALCSVLEDAGVHVVAKDQSINRRVRTSVRIEREVLLRPVQVTTQPHPGFPTDIQAQLMALLSTANGNSVVTERIYPERFMHVPELGRMGAQVFRQGPTVVVSGVRELVGAQVMASDLRASASLVLAGLAARGTTTIRRVYHLDRGYWHMETQLRALGAEIQRVNDREIDEPPIIVTTSAAVPARRAVVAGR